MTHACVTVPPGGQVSALQRFITAAFQHGPALNAMVNWDICPGQMAAPQLALVHVFGNHGWQKFW